MSVSFYFFLHLVFAYLAVFAIWPPEEEEEGKRGRSWNHRHPDPPPLEPTETKTEAGIPENKVKDSSLVCLQVWLL